MLYMCKDGFDEKVREYVQQGGSFLTTYFSGYVEDHDLVTLGGYPGRLKDILGIWVEESDALPPEEDRPASASFRSTPGYAGGYRFPEYHISRTQFLGNTHLCGYELLLCRVIPLVPWRSKHLYGYVPSPLRSPVLHSSSPRGHGS